MFACNKSLYLLIFYKNINYNIYLLLETLFVRQKSPEVIVFAMTYFHA